MTDEICKHRRDSPLGRVLYSPCWECETEEMHRGVPIIRVEQDPAKTEVLDKA